MHAEDASTTFEKIDDSDADFLLEKGETAYRVYKGLWQEFYAWEHDHSRQTILGLSRTETPIGGLLCELDDIFNYQTNEYTEWFTVERWDCQNSAFSVEQIPTLFYVEEEGISPHPRYTACTPSSTSVLYPPNFLWTAPFVPYSDDENFPLEEYLLHFKTFGWQTDFWDPDSLWIFIFCMNITFITYQGELIFYETARRLHFTHQFSYSEIDNLQLYHLPLRRSAVAGLIWDISQRSVSQNDVRVVADFFVASSATVSSGLDQR